MYLIFSKKLGRVAALPLALSWLSVGISGWAAPSSVEIAGDSYCIIMETARPGIVRIENLRMSHGQGIFAPAAPQPLFSLTIRAAEPPPGHKPQTWKITSRDFRTTGLKTANTSTGKTVVWDMAWKADGANLNAHLVVRSDSGPESLWSLTLKPDRELDLEIAFPIFDGLKLGSKTEDVWYFHPRWCGLLNDAPVDLASTYGQYVRMQAMAAYNPSGAGDGPAGIYLVTRDTRMLRKTYELVKRIPGTAEMKLRDEYGFNFWSGFEAKDGVGMAINWIRIPLRAGKAYQLPAVAIGIGACDWRDALTSYRAWSARWYPLHNRNARDCFHHTSFYLFSQPSCDAALAELDRHSYPDYMQFMVQKTHVNGEYGYREDWGLPELQRFVQECKNRGIITNHYVEGYIAATGSRIWQEKGKEWGQMHGSNYQMAFANQCMWLGCEEWHQWLVGETTRLAKDLKLDSIYLDEIGFGTGDKCFSDNPHHSPGRLQPDGVMVGVRDLLRAVRAGLDDVNQDISIYTEGPAVDCLFPYLDGVEDYSCRQWNSLPESYRIPVHFLRFVFPDFKFADIPEGTREEMDRQIRLCLFNGIGAMTDLSSGDPAEWTKRVHVVSRENRDAFNDMNPKALIPIAAEGVYCNQFSAPPKTIFTLYNTNAYPVAGRVLDLPLRAGHHWVDLIRSEDLRIDKERAVLELGPSDVAVIAELPIRLKVRKIGERVWLTSRPIAGDESLVLALLDVNGLQRESRPFQPSTDGFSIAEVSKTGRYRVVLKLYKDGVLLDVLPLPDLPHMDLAEAAKVTASVRSDEAAVVNSDVPGSYALRWNDDIRWVQYEWPVPQTFNRSELRCTDSHYSPQRYSYLASDDGAEWREILEVDREGKSNFNVQDHLPGVTARFLRLQIRKGGPWGDCTDISRWRVFCRPADLEDN